MLIHKIDVFPHSIIDKIKLKADDSTNSLRLEC